MGVGTWCSDINQPRFDLIVYHMRKRKKTFVKLHIFQQTRKRTNKAGLESRLD